ncbi:MAG: YHS domain-containing protein [Ignavibacteriales bacterium]|nr:YHS domain-containing protein [Ignavibacteriales bacterium]
MDKTSQTYRSWNKICPVLGFKVNPKIKPVEYKGKLYGFCCKVCPPKFTQEPDKYINNLNLKGDKFVGKKPNN